jgi:hypothetical protein
MKLVERFETIMTEKTEAPFDMGVKFKTFQGLQHWLSKAKNGDYDGPVSVGSKQYKNAKEALKDYN